MNADKKRFLIGVLSACFLAVAGVCLAADDAAVKPESKDAKAAPAANSGDKSDKDAKKAAKKPVRELSPALAALRDRVRGVLAEQRQQGFNTGENTPTEIMNYCLAFGCATEVSLEGVNGNRINGITSLCWNYPCGGFEMLAPSGRHISAHIGYGYQEHAGEFLAMLAMSRVQEDYPIRAGKDVRKVADLIAAEKLACRSGSDESLRLIGLAYYVDEPEWKNDLGETWSVERMTREEMLYPVQTAAEGGLNRLTALSYAVSRRAKLGRPIDGDFKRARKYVSDFQEFALRLQNTDGSWGPYFLSARSTSPEAPSQLRSTGRILEWLATSLPDKQVEDQRVINAVEYVTNLLDGQRYQWNARSITTRDIASMGHALHALSVYDERVFKPADVPAEKPTEVKTAAAAN